MIKIIMTTKILKYKIRCKHHQLYLYFLTEQEPFVVTSPYKSQEELLQYPSFYFLPINASMNRSLLDGESVVFYTPTSILSSTTGYFQVSCVLTSKNAKHSPKHVYLNLAFVKFDDKITKMEQEISF